MRDDHDLQSLIPSHLSLKNQRLFTMATRSVALASSPAKTGSNASFNDKVRSHIKSEMSTDVCLEELGQTDGSEVIEYGCCKR